MQREFSQARLCSLIHVILKELMKPYTITTVPSRLERFADVLLAVVLGIGIAFGLFIYVS